jgi:hypothetical protein
MPKVSVNQRTRHDVGWSDLQHQARYNSSVTDGVWLYVRLRTVAKRDSEKFLQMTFVHLARLVYFVA